MAEDKALLQIQQMLETLIETTDHFAVLIKEEDLNQSVYMFTKIVEGSQAVVNTLHKVNSHFNNEAKSLEKALINITNELEKREFESITESIQTILHPILEGLNQSLMQELVN